MSEVNAFQQSPAGLVNGMTIHADESVTLSAARALICLQATWEIDALARALPDLVPHTEETIEARLVVRGIAARIMQLNEAVMGGINDDAETVNRLHNAVNLKYMEATNV